MNQIKQGYKQTKVGIIPKDWNVVKVGEKFDFLKTYSNSREDLNNVDEISYIHYGEIHTKHKFYIDFGKFELPKINKSKLPNEIIFAQNGDLVIADASEDYADIGKSAEIKNLTSKAVSGLHTFLLRDNNNNFANGYKGYLFYNETVAKSIKKIATGISVLGISKTNLSKLEIPLPPLKEQEKIAEILTIWDEAITKQEELIKAKELQKKGLMQKLLSGEVRFDGFDNEWEEVRLGEIVKKMQSGGTPKADNQEFYNGNIPFVKVNDITSSGKYLIKTESSITEKGLKNSSAWIVPINSIIYSMYASVGFLSINTIEVATSQAMINIILDLEKANLEYIYYHLLDFKKNVHTYVETGTQGNLNAQTVRNLKIKLPSLPEQQKIAEVLSLADDEINLLKNELEELKLQKKALMQKLLTGEVRVRV